MVCPSCRFNHFEPVNQTVQAHMSKGKPLLVPSGFKIMCSQCGSLCRFTADAGVKLVIEARAKDAKGDEAALQDKGDDDGLPDTDIRLPRWQRRQAERDRKRS